MTGNNLIHIDFDLAYCPSTRTLDKAGWEAKWNVTELTGGPQFVSTSNPHLQSSPPAIYRGKTLTEVQDDVDVNQRPQEDAYDIGANEVSGNPK